MRKPPVALVRLPLRLAVAAIAATVLFTPAAAQTAPATTARKSPVAPRPSQPTWSELTPAQKEALAPLSADWDGFEHDRKLKWLEVAKKYPQLSPDGKARLHQRMGEFGKLSAEQRRNVRENFRKAYELPIDRRQALIEEYKGLPPERKRELSDKAKSSAAGEKSARDNRRARESKKPVPQ